MASLDDVEALIEEPSWREFDIEYDDVHPIEFSPQHDNWSLVFALTRSNDGDGTILDGGMRLTP